MQNYTLKQLLAQISYKLSLQFTQPEAQAIKKQLVEDMLGINYHQAYLNPDKVVIPKEKVSGVLQAADRIVGGTPLQYATGVSHFLGLTFRVTPDVLIPRPETEELVSMIIKGNRFSNPVILDVGTGSGCIAISLARFIHGAKVLALDISEAALGVARENAMRNGVNVEFIQTDILTADKLFESSTFDIVVSNPPYVRESEKELMHANVLDFEPHQALFVADENPLIFYHSIAKCSANWLKSAGVIYFEINEALGEEVRFLLDSYGFYDVQVLADFRGKHRFAFGKNREK